MDENEDLLNYLINAKYIRQQKSKETTEVSTAPVDKLNYENKNVVPEIGMLAKKGKKKIMKLRKKKEEQEPTFPPVPQRSDDHYLKLDENWDILELLRSRMKLGAQRYGHGLRVHDNTRKYGTKDDSWEEMCLEELLDATVYLSGAIIRREKRQKYDHFRTQDDSVYDEYRKRFHDRSWLLKKEMIL
jgi:hypothetical protein